MTPFFCVPRPSPNKRYGRASIIIPKLKRELLFQKFSIACFFQKVYFSVYIETSRELLPLIQIPHPELMEVRFSANMMALVILYKMS